MPKQTANLIEQMDAHYTKAADLAKEVLIIEARKVLKRCPHLHTFVTGMGTWFFCTYPNAWGKTRHYSVGDRVVEPVNDFLSEWDDRFGLTGEYLCIDKDGNHVEGNPEPPTAVVFRWWRGSVIALFPTIDYDHTGQYCVSYQRIGQHGGADYTGIVRSSRPATEAEYAALKNELEGIGYTLKVYQRQPPRGW